MARLVVRLSVVYRLFLTFYIVAKRYVVGIGNCYWYL